MSPPLRVVFVHDGSVPTLDLLALLRANVELAVVGEAEFSAAVAVVARHLPEAIVLRVRDGRDALRTIGEVMAGVPTPLLVLSNTPALGEVSRGQALAAGAADAVPVPVVSDTEALSTMYARLRSIRGMGVMRHPRGARRPAPGLASNPMPVVAIAASTGGPQAVATILGGIAGLPAPVLVVQHLQADFVDGFVSWMARVSPLPVELAIDGARLRPGVVYIGPGNLHLKLDTGRRMLLDPEPLSLHRPSADALFRSLALNAGSMGVGVVLTGIGDDGATALLELRRQGGVTIAQDAETAAVDGMPRAARRLDAASQVLALHAIGKAISNAAIRLATA